MTRILLVEDHRAFSEGLAFMLDQESDVRVVGRTDSAADCRQYLSGGEEFDVAVVDLYLADSEGIELVDEMRGSCPDTPLIVLTISLDPADHGRAKEAGADEVITKVSALDEIIATIKRLGDG